MLFNARPIWHCFNLLIFIYIIIIYIRIITKILQYTVEWDYGNNIKNIKFGEFML